MSNNTSIALNAFLADLANSQNCVKSAERCKRSRRKAVAKAQAKKNALQLRKSC